MRFFSHYKPPLWATLLIVSIFAVVLMTATLYNRAFLSAFEWEEKRGNFHSVKEMVDEINRLVQLGRFQQAASLLDSIGEAEIEHAIGDPDPVRARPEQQIYVAYCTDLVVLPGVPRAVEDELLRSGQYLEIPGTGDDVDIKEGIFTAIGTHPIRDQWFRAVHDFAKRVNATVYRSQG